MRQQVGLPGVYDGCVGVRLGILQCIRIALEFLKGTLCQTLCSMSVCPAMVWMPCPVLP